MRQYPRFTEKEITYIEDMVMKSDTELIDEGMPFGVKSFSPFKNDLANKLTKYSHVIRERKFNRCEV